MYLPHAHMDILPFILTWQKDFVNPTKGDFLFFYDKNTALRGEKKHILSKRKRRERCFFVLAFLDVSSTYYKKEINEEKGVWFW